MALLAIVDPAERALFAPIALCPACYGRDEARRAAMEWTVQTLLATGYRDVAESGDLEWRETTGFPHYCAECGAEDPTTENLLTTRGDDR